MSLIYCPECGHEISQAAIACPNCGRPINAAPPVERIVVTKPRFRESIPPWAIIPIALAAIALLFFLFYAMSRNDETADSNLNVNVSARRAVNRDNPRDVETHTTNIPASGTSVTTAPPSSSSETQTVTVPGSQTSVPANLEKGRVIIDAKVVTRNGSPQAVRNEKFYLLDKDLESILQDADLDPIEGQTMANSFGLAVIYPDRYRDFYREALAAIKEHIKYAGTTDRDGKAQLGSVEPNSYYLFGITKTGRGFALWSTPVSIRAGENVLNLTPQRITEMDAMSGAYRSTANDSGRDTIGK